MLRRPGINPGDVVLSGRSIRSRCQGSCARDLFGRLLCHWPRTRVVHALVVYSTILRDAAGCGTPASVAKVVAICARHISAHHWDLGTRPFANSGDRETIFAMCTQFKPITSVYISSHNTYSTIYVLDWTGYQSLLHFGIVLNPWSLTLPNRTERSRKPLITA